MIKIVSDKQKKVYELTYLLPAFFTSAELSKTQAAIEDLIKKHKGSVLATEEWGKRELAYKIKKSGKTHQEAIYFHLRVEFLPEKILNFNKDLKLEEAVIRHLLVVAGKEEAEEKKG